MWVSLWNATRFKWTVHAGGHHRLTVADGNNTCTTLLLTVSQVLERQPHFWFGGPFDNAESDRLAAEFGTATFEAMANLVRKCDLLGSQSLGSQSLASEQEIGQVIGSTTLNLARLVLSPSDGSEQSPASLEAEIKQWCAIWSTLGDDARVLASNETRNLGTRFTKETARGWHEAGAYFLLNSIVSCSDPHYANNGVSSEADCRLYKHDSAHQPDKESGSRYPQVQ